MKEIKRVENFESGDVNCVSCGKTLHIWFNGGELDEVECCGMIYRTEHQQIDLVVYQKNAEVFDAIAKLE